MEVADTTLATDRTEKLRCYASNSIPEYWIINLQNETIEVYREPSKEEYRDRDTKTRGETVDALFAETLSCAVDTLLPERSSEQVE